MKLILLSIIVLLSGCLSVKKAEKQLNNIKDKYPELVAEKTSEWFPCFESVESIDSSEYKEWTCIIDSIKNSQTIVIDTIKIEKLVKDSQSIKSVMQLRNEIYKSYATINSLKFALNQKPPTIIKTIKVVDSAKTFLNSDELKRQIALKEKYQTKFQRWLSISFWVIVVCGLLLLYLLFKK